MIPNIICLVVFTIPGWYSTLALDSKVTFLKILSSTDILETVNKKLWEDFRVIFIDVESKLIFCDLGLLDWQSQDSSKFQDSSDPLPNHN